MASNSKAVAENIGGTGEAAVQQKCRLRTCFSRGEEDPGHLEIQASIQEPELLPGL